MDYQDRQDMEKAFELSNNICHHIADVLKDNNVDKLNQAMAIINDIACRITMGITHGMDEDKRRFIIAKLAGGIVSGCEIFIQGEKAMPMGPKNVDEFIKSLGLEGEKS